MKKIIHSLIFALFLFYGICQADEAPVVDVNENSTGGDQTVSSVSSPSDNNTNPFTRNYGSDSNSAANVPQNQSAAPSSPVPASVESMPLDQRVARLEQQVSNLVGMNLPQQVTDIQQSLQQLQGQLQVEQHDLQLLSQQQRNFYQDLDHRIAQLKNPASGSASAQNDNNDMPPAKPIASNIQSNDSNAYRSAFVLLSQKNYDQAKLGFKNYIEKFPKGHFLQSAHYWLGEINLLQKNYTQASEQFNTIITKYPNSPKILDAKLKLAVVHINQGKIAIARKELEAIKNQNPNTTAAQLASIHLQQLDEMTQPPSS